MLPERFQQNSKILENLHVWGACANLSVGRNFAQGIESHQRPHQSRAIASMKAGKLSRSETNAQILSNLHFFIQNLHFFDTPIDARFPMLRNYSKSLKGSTNHFPCACITLEQTFSVVGLPLSSSNDLPSRLPSSPPPRYPTHHVSTPSSLPSSAPVDLAGHLPNTGKFKATNKNSGGCAEDQKRPRKSYKMPTADFHF